MNPSKGPSGEDRRKHKRLPEIFMVTYRLKTSFALALVSEGRELAGVGVDISVAGLGIDLAEPITAGTLVRLKFKLTNDFAVSAKNRERTFQLDAECRYCEPTPKKSYRAGVLFKNAADDDTEFITAYVADQALAKTE